MRAVRVRAFGGPEVLRLEEVPDPVPGSGEVLVQVHAAGINPVDTYIRAGAYGELPDLPYVPGSDAAGVVEAVGAGVESHRPGDRVYVAGWGGRRTGGHAERLTCFADQAWPLPAKCSFSEGAAIGIPCATAYRALVQLGEAVAGDTLLVHGAAGSVGSAAVQLAVSRGLRVFGTASSAEGREFVRSQGAQGVFDHSAPDHLDIAMEAAGIDGFDLILEMAAHRNLNDDLQAVAPGGRIVVIGSRGRIEIDPRHAMMRDATVRGLALANASGDEMAEIHRALGAALAEGSLHPAVSAELPLERAAEAHALVVETGRNGKVVLIP
ncbi:MAG: NADPH:quinone reductase [Acidobacteriota bacterium]